MKWLVVAALFLAAGGFAGASGMSEDPGEVLEKTWNLPALTSLEVRGEVQFTLVPGGRGTGTKVTVTTTRALFDQLTVSEWFGSGTVAIETGLRGPRERGTVQVAVRAESLRSLTVLGRSRGKVTWPGDRGRVTVGEESSLDASLDTLDFTVETSWLTSVSLSGRTGLLEAGLRHQSRLDARGLAAGEARVALDEASVYRAGPTGKGTAQSRHGSRLELPEGPRVPATGTWLVPASPWKVESPDREPGP